jgi:hypothetical protein
MSRLFIRRSIYVRGAERQLCCRSGCAPLRLSGAAHATRAEGVRAAAGVRERALEMLRLVFSCSVPGGQRTTTSGRNHAG